MKKNGKIAVSYLLSLAFGVEPSVPRGAARLVF